MAHDVPSFTSMPIASMDVEKHCPIRAMKVATHLLRKTFSMNKGRYPVMPSWVKEVSQRMRYEVSTIPTKKLNHL